MNPPDITNEDRINMLTAFPVEYARLYTKTGRLKDYAFNSGHMETKRNRRFILFSEMNVYHVKGFLVSGEKVWETFNKLADARNYFDNN